jgi:putative salt-induced outer membrane protein
MVKITLLAGLFLVATSLYAQDETAADDGWTGAGEFGLVSTTGNTDSTALNLKLEFVRSSETWRHRVTGTALMTDKDGEKDNERYTLEGQSDRNLNEKSYILGVVRWDSDKFGPYDPQMTATVGYGRHLIKTDQHQLKAEVGAGYRKLEERTTGITHDEAIFRFLADDAWQITESTLWTNRLLVEAGSDNTFTQFNTALAVAMNAKLSLKLGFEFRNNTDLPPGNAENTDTVTTANLVYNF